MLRPLVTIAVLLGFLASQLVAMPHAHAFATPAEQREHDAHPHVHVGHSHDHSHDHRHDSEGSNRDVPDNGGNDHDADAIYLPAANQSTLIKSGQDQRLGNGPSRIDELAASAIFSDDESSITGGVPWHPPDACASSRPLFLTLRTLRI